MTSYAPSKGGRVFYMSWMLRFCTRPPEGAGLFTCYGCFDFVRTDQRVWDLLGIMDVMTLYAVTRGGGVF